VSSTYSPKDSRSFPGAALEEFESRILAARSAAAIMAIELQTVNSREHDMNLVEVVVVAATVLASLGAAAGIQWAGLWLVFRYMKTRLNSY
jgi:hypothetical protein